MNTPKFSPYLLFAVFLIIAAFLRFYQLDSIPTGIYGDEAFNGNDSIKALVQRDINVFYPSNNGREGLFVWMLTVPHLLFDPSEFSLRITSAVVGFLTVLLLPLLVFKAMNYFAQSSRKNESLIVVTALAASFFLATSYWHINFSRIAFRAILDPLFSVLAILLLIVCLDNRKRIFISLVAGFVVGLGLYGYGTYKFMCLPIIYMFVSSWSRNNRPFLTNYVLVILLGIITILPLAIYIIDNHSLYFMRLDAIASLSQDEPLIKKYFQSLIEIFKMFFVEGDSNLRHNLDSKPQLTLLTGISLIVGAINIFLAAIRNKFEKPSIAIINQWIPTKFARLLIVWWFAMHIPFSLLYYGEPHALRAIGLIVPTMIISGIGFACIFYAVKQLIGAKLKSIMFVLIFSLLTFTVSKVAKDYFDEFVNHKATKHFFQLDRTQSAKLLVKSNLNQRKIILVFPEDGQDETWDIQQFLYFTQGDLSKYNAEVMTFENFKAVHKNLKALLFVPTPKLANVQELFDEDVLLYSY